MLPLLLIIIFVHFFTSAIAANTIRFPKPENRDTVQVFKAIKWQFQTRGKIFSTPAIANGIVYIGSEDSSLYAIDQSSGKLKWKFNAKGKINSSATVFNNTVFFGSYDGYYYALNAENGRAAWKFQTGGEKHIGAKGLWTMKPNSLYMDDPFDFFLSSPAIDSVNGNVCFGSSDGNVYALSARKGTMSWKQTTQGPIHATPLLHNGVIYIGSWDFNLYAINANNGSVKWKFKTNEQPTYHILEGIQAAPVADDSLIYFGARDAFFYALNANTGTLVWKFNAGGSWVVASANLKDNAVFFSTSDSYSFIAVNKQTGKELYRIKANGYIYNKSAIANKIAYFGDFTGQLFAIDIASGKQLDVFAFDTRKTNAQKVLKNNNLDFSYAAEGKDLMYYQTSVEAMNRLYTLGSIVSSSVIVNNVLYVGSADGNLYAVELGTE
ncbi:PQQ-binding-like beta-propeller repeat protein [Pinibacter soli]|uniref:PQQ-binding-like beta-propeller repeat protein n=1 Tax=Pinibacter soli TaxID=3044211 RepID=A0ABT6RD71_9BACT|nr:PQQ-binding-like beta-propeller repeat protein [Pinibacter soli]MDI3320527.1 PQQ-binding-like beta-propeller repeat protein [Pinibacter soli]